MSNSPSKDNNPWKQIEGKYTWHQSKLNETPKIFLHLLSPDDFLKAIKEIEVTYEEVNPTEKLTYENPLL